MYVVENTISFSLLRNLNEIDVGFGDKHCGNIEGQTAFFNSYPTRQCRTIYPFLFISDQRNESLGYATNTSMGLIIKIVAVQ